MKKDGKQGDSTKTGKEFEEKVDFIRKVNKLEGYSTKSKSKNNKYKTYIYEIKYKNKVIAESFKKHAFYRYLKNKDSNFNWKNIISKQLLPDDAIYVHKNNTIYIIEIKFQEEGGSGSVDEKPQTCFFKIKQYRKLLYSFNYNVEFIYILSDKFKDEKYKDMLDYIKEVGCKYYFDEIKLNELCFPSIKEKNGIK